MTGPVDAVRRALPVLRQRLIDLTASNRLIGFRHDPRSRTQLRLVGVAPDPLLQAVLDGRGIGFMPVAEPDPVDETEDEAFALALLEARAAQAGLPVPDGVDPETIEAALRARVREALGRPERPPEPSLEDLARRAGFDPSLELAPGDRPVRTLGCLMRRTDLDRRLASVAEAARELAREQGVQALRLALGFLEWRESPDQRRPYLSPLLLVPADLDRRLEGGVFTATLRGTGEPVEVNAALHLRLIADHGVGLPDRSDDDTAEAYFAKVAERFADRPGWHVRRFATLGIFGFARLALHADLDPRRWTRDPLEASGVLAALFGGRPQGGGTERTDRAMRDEEIETRIPLLISDTDGSQAAAIADALDGRDLVIEGPPGTGKSQTITNLVAAAMAEGKRILVLAEKAAALDVVAKRLRDAGLGPFCLELHGEKGRPAAVAAQLAERLQIVAGDDPRDLAATLDGRRRERDRLGAYAAALASPVGGDGATAHDVLWREIAGRADDERLPETLRGLVLPGVETLTGPQLRALGDAVTELARLDQQLADSPWLALNDEVDETDGITAALQRWSDGLAAVSTAVETLGVPAGTAAEVARRLRDLSDPGALDGALALLFENETTATDVADLLLRARSLVTLRARVAAVFADRPTAVRLRRMVELLDATGLAALDPAPLTDARDRLARDLADRRDGERLLALWHERLGLPAGSETPAGMVAALGLLATLPPAARDTLPTVGADAAADRQAAARAALAARSAVADAPELDPARVRAATEDLAAAAEDLERAGIFAILSPKARRAERLWRSIARDGASADRTRMATGLRAAALLRDAPPSDATDWTAVADAAAYRLAARALCTPAGTMLATLDRPPTVTEEDLARLRRMTAAFDAEAARSRLGHLEEALRLATETGLKAAVDRAGLETLAQAVEEMTVLAREVEAHPAVPVLGAVWAGADTPFEALGQAADWARRTAGLPTTMRRRLLADPARQHRRLVDVATTVLRATAEAEAGRRLAHSLCDLDRLLGDVADVRTAIAAVMARGGELADRVSATRLRADLRRQGVGVLLDAGLAADHLVLAWTRLRDRSLARAAVRRFPVLAQESGLGLEQARQRFQRLDREMMGIGRRLAAARAALRPVDPGNASGPRGTWTGRALVANEAGKRRRHIPVRELIGRAGDAVGALKPVVLASPVTLAQLSPPEAMAFDLLVIDEASQMRPEDALGALARADQVVVVGDPRQLPPTSFFDRVEDVGSEEAPDDGAESLLDLAIATFHPTRRLRWHYRSRHPALIAFSNRRFYDDDLIVFPAAVDRDPDLGVHRLKVEGRYGNGVNPDEARAVARAAIERMHRRPDRSLGVVAMNRAQADLIREEIETLLRNDRQAAAYVAAWDAGIEPFFVKNLEMVQGDERDAILISTVYGPDASGRVAQRFGPINGRDGWRRLNVLFTRAKETVLLVTSMDAADVRVDEATSRGVVALRDYIAYAADGRLESGDTTGRGPDSPFETWVLASLRAAGWEVEPQVGVAGFRIDLAVRDPDDRSRFVIGIECDGATWHGTPSARDRDRLRQQVLEGLGWEIVRVWSTDWFADPAREMQRLKDAIAGAVSRARAARRAAEAADAEFEGIGDVPHEAGLPVPA